ncbi:RDD family protein [bacterium]|nr:RDD family protein [bacterium]
MRQANPLKRVAADLLDGIILIAVKLVIAGGFIAVSELLLNLEPWGKILCWALWIFYILTITFLFFAYYIFFFTLYSASPGKLLFDLKVVDDETGCYPITKKQAFLRALGYLIAGAPLYLGIVWILFDRKGQGWQDKIAGTRMIDLSGSQP